MFRTVPLSIIRSFSLYTQQWCMTYRFDDSSLASCQQTSMYCCVYSENHIIFLGAFADVRKATVSFVICVCPSEWKNSSRTGRIFMKFYFSKICREISVFVKMCQEYRVLHMETYVYLWQYLA